jgi:hypothetical protein
MVTRLSASQARLKVEMAKKLIEEQRIREKEIKRNQAKERAFLLKGFERQRELIISAAIDGNTEIEVDSVFLFRELIDSGIEVVERGLVRKQADCQETKINPSQLEHLKEEILEQFDKFIDDAKSDLKGYYGGLKRFHKFNYDSLYTVINSERRHIEYGGDYIYIEDVPDNFKEKYRKYLDKINEKIQAYKEYKEDGSNEIHNYETEDDLVEGDYCFSDENEEIDVLKPSVEGNTLKIRWNSEEGSTFMNAPLLSDIGLAWLSTYRGQILIEEVFNALSESAEMGKSSMKLDFSLTKDGWYFHAGGREIFCCMPDELVDIIARENFTIDDTIATEKTYSIKVSW